MNTLQNNVSNSFYTKFYPSLQAFTGSAISTLIIGKLEFWFSYDKYRESFYKFVEPCKSPLYRAGDSWSEELCVSRKIFNKAFDIIGVRYKSKSDYLNAEDTFQGKLYASYHDRKTNRTYYVRNHEFMSQILLKVLSKKTPPKGELKAPKVTKQKVKKEAVTLPQTLSQKTESQNSSSGLSQGRSRNGDLGRSYVRVPSFIHKETSSLNNTTQEFISNTPVIKTPGQMPAEKDFTDGMIKIWNEEVGELGVAFTKGLSTRLSGTLKTCFTSSLEAWGLYCQMISSSKFLMGEAENKFFKKAWITWAIKPEIIDKIKGGAYNLGDRPTNKDKEIDTINHEIQMIEIKKRSIERSINNIKTSIIDKRNKETKEKMENMSEEEETLFQKEFIQNLEIEDSPITNEYKRAGWKGLFVECSYFGFLREKLSTQLFEISPEVNETQAIQSSGLLEILEDVEDELNQLKQKKRDVESKCRAPLEQLIPLESFSHHTLMVEDCSKENPFNPVTVMRKTVDKARGIFNQEQTNLSQGSDCYAAA